MSELTALFANGSRMYDIGEHLGEKFLTMELIDGSPLSQILGVEQGSPHALPVNRALPIVIEICAGLHAAHEIGIIHREIMLRADPSQHRSPPSQDRGKSAASLGCLWGWRLWGRLVARGALGVDPALQDRTQGL